MHDYIKFWFAKVIIELTVVGIIMIIGLLYAFGSVFIPYWIQLYQLRKTRSEAERLTKASAKAKNVP